MRVIIVRFINIFSASILAGVSVGIWIGFNPLSLSPSTYIEQQQNMLESLRILMVVLVVLTTCLSLLSAYLHRMSRSDSICLLTASFFFLACILITRFGNKPIDDLVVKWTAVSVPENWTEFRNKWWIMHIVRTIAEVLGLLLVIWAGINKNVPNGKN